MGVKAIFWFVLLVWIADILQPGYLQFYNWRNAVALVQKLQFSSSAVVPTAAPGVNMSSTPVPKRYSPQVSRVSASQNLLTRGLARSAIFVGNKVTPSEVG